MSISSQSESNPAQPQIRVLTLNCWGVPIIAKDLNLRMAAIGSSLASQNFDIVCLQEVYFEDHQLTISRGAAKGGLIYNQYFRSGLFGSGLMILSKFPILESVFKPYLLNGRPQDLIRSDYYAGKGYAIATIASPYGELRVINTHLIAAYLEIGDDVYLSHRIAQAIELAYEIQNFPDSTPVLLLGDLNSVAEKIPYRVINELAVMKDSFTIANPDDKGITVTTDIPYLTRHEPERIDYILWKNGENSGFNVVKSEIVYKGVPEDWKGRIKAYSDHYGVATTFELQEDKKKPENPFSFSQSLLVPDVKDVLDNNLSLNQDHQPQNRIYASLWGIGVLVALVIGKRKTKRRDFLRILLGMIGFISFTAMGFQISLGIHTTKEIAAYQEVLRKLKFSKQ